MKKLFIIVMMFVLVGCSTESTMTEEQATLLKNAIQEIDDANAVSVSLEDRMDSKYLNKEGGETRTITSHIAYRYHGFIADAQYVNVETVVGNQDFQQELKNEIYTFQDRKHRESSKPFDHKVTAEELEAVNIFFIKISNSLDLGSANVKESKGEKIYTFDVSDDDYQPYLNLKNSFDMIEANSHEIIEYTFVLEDDHIKSITLIYNATDDVSEHVVNVSLTVHALNDEVKIPYLDVGTE